MSAYLALADLQNYGIPSGTTVSAVENDNLQKALDWAEGTFERLAGSRFNTQTVTETATRGWVDRFGWVTLISSVAPVTAVASVTYQVPPVVTPVTLTWNAASGLILPPATSPPDKSAWSVLIAPTNALPNYAADNIYFKWTYTAGYTTIPNSLKFVLLRLAWWKYKLREAPLGKVAVPPMGITEVIPDLPRDIYADVLAWQRVSG